jgi:ribosomal protein S18 acetylase RimI-like enzyme
MSPPVALRTSRSIDAGLFYEVTEQTMRAHIIAAGGAWDEERRREETTEVSLDPNARVIVVGTVDAGILLVERSPNEMHLHILYLFPIFQRLGIGSTLVSSLQREAVERYVPLRLKVLKVNPAKGFYERLGFSVEEETEHFFCMQNATIPSSGPAYGGPLEANVE